MLFFATCGATSATAQSADAALQQAVQLKTGQSRQWKALLHFQEDTDESSLVSPAFFLAKNGRTNPDAELAATLRAFYAPANAVPSEMHAQCRFPARFLFLNKTLSLKNLPAPACVAGVSPSNVTLIYVEPSFHSPASLFGHSFLRLNDVKETYAATYGAITGTDTPFQTVFKGVSGKYQGILTLQPYAETFFVHNDQENRGIWEYTLNTSDYQRALFAAHLQEMGDARANYYFFSENCALMTAELLDVLYPEARMAESLRRPAPVGGVTPVGVIHALNRAEPTAVTSVTHIPAKHPSPTASDISPDAMHAPAAVDFAGGTRNGKAFAAFHIRPAYHTMTDPSTGTVGMTEIDVLSSQIRYYRKKNNWRLHDLTLLKIASFAPNGVSAISSAFSFKTGIDSYNYPAKEDAGYTGYLGTEIGMTSAVFKQTVFYVTGTAHARVGGYLPDIVMGGGGIKAGIATEIKNLRAHLSAQHIFYTDSAATVTQYRAEVSFSPAHSVTLFARYGFDDTTKQDTHDVMTGIRFYF